METYTSQNATSQEKEELLEWMQDSEDDTVLKGYVQNLWNGYNPKQTFSEVDWNGIFDAIVSHGDIVRTTPRSGSLFIKRYRIAAAVALLIILSAASYFIFFEKSSHQQPVNNVALIHDIEAPQTNRATLTLSNGQNIYLDSMAKGALVAQGGVNVLKLSDGKIMYEGSASEELYNVLTNPLGSRVVDIVLGDGTHIWLNSGSSIRYPAAFVGNERKVSITGEVYFEVAHDSKRPFKVLLPALRGAEAGEITVLGTHFNVNAYSDENAIKTTLLEGSVQLNFSPSSSAGQYVRLKPGQQARMSETLVVADDENVEAVMAWKKDRFDFGEKTDIKTLMRQLARWYDIDVRYTGKITSHFGGSISRKVNVSEVLKLLEATGGIKFSIEGKTVTITPSL